MVVEFEKNDNINLNFLYKFKLNSLIDNNKNDNDDNYEENYNNYGIILCDMINMRKEVIDYAKQCQKNNIFKQDNIFDSSKEINILKMVFIKLIYFCY